MSVKGRKLISLNKEITDDIERRIKEDNFNFSKWVEDTYIKLEMSEKGLRIQQKYHEKMSKKLRNQADFSAKKRQNLLKNLDEAQRKELLEAKKVINNNPSFLEGRRKYWNNVFKMNLSKAEYMELLGGEKNG